VAERKDVILEQSKINTKREMLKHRNQFIDSLKNKLLSEKNKMYGDFKYHQFPPAD
jgi:hypothetical protein